MDIGPVNQSLSPWESILAPVVLPIVVGGKLELCVIAGDDKVPEYPVVVLLVRVQLGHVIVIVIDVPVIVGASHCRGIEWARDFAHIGHHAQLVSLGVQGDGVVAIITHVESHGFFVVAMDEVALTVDAPAVGPTAWCVLDGDKVVAAKEASVGQNATPTAVKLASREQRNLCVKLLV